MKNPEDDSQIYQDPETGLFYQFDPSSQLYLPASMPAEAEAGAEADAEGEGDGEYEYYQRPLSSKSNGGYSPEAMEHTFVLRQESPVATLIEEQPHSPPSKPAGKKRHLKWWLVALLLIVIGVGAALTGVYVSKAKQGNNSVNDSSAGSASGSGADAAGSGLGSIVAGNRSGSTSVSTTNTATISTLTTATISTSSTTTTTTTTTTTIATSTTSTTTSIAIAIATTTTQPQPTSSPQPTSGLPKDVGNCISGSYPFTFARTTTSGYSGTVDPNLSTAAYDFIIPYNTGNVQMDGDGSLKINLIKNSGSAASGAILTTSRYMWYGKFSVSIQAVNVGGAITTFITMSDQGDEIDIEICGKPVAPYTNVFYDTVGKSEAQKEYFSHYDIIDGIDMSVPHTYTIDWKHESLTWLVDGVVVRTLLKAESFSSMNPTGPKWFPVTPSLVQFGVWDASFAADPRTVDWAGGPIDWGSRSSYTATFSNFQVTCYDPNDNAVSQWP